MPVTARRALARLVVGALLAVPAGACSEELRDAPADLFSGDVRALVLEIDYQPGAEPHLEPRRLPSGAVVPPLSMTRTNLEQLFEREPPLTIVVPQTLADMQALDDVTSDRFTDAEILAIARAHRDASDGPAARVLYAVFLDGYYERDGEVRPDVLGVTPSDRERVVALFAPAIAAGEVPGFVEQSTLVHELGHAIGLVNDGVPLVSEHHDAEHGAHCTNDACVMFHLNEGLLDLQQFITRTVTTGTPTLFGLECLRDVRAAQQR